MSKRKALVQVVIKINSP